MTDQTKNDMTIQVLYFGLIRNVVMVAEESVTLPVGGQSCETSLISCAESTATLPATSFSLPTERSCQTPSFCSTGAISFTEKGWTLKLTLGVPPIFY